MESKKDITIKRADEKDQTKDIEKQFVKTTLGINEEKEISNRRKIFKRIISVIFLIFVVGVLVYTAINDFTGNREVTAKPKDVGRILADNWFYVIFAILSITVCVIVKGLERSIVSKSVTGKFYFTSSLFSGLVGQTYNYVTPLSAGGQPFEVFYFARKAKIDGGKASSITIATYIINQIAGITLGLFALICYDNNLIDFPTLDYMPQTLFIMAIVGLSLTMIVPLLVAIFSFLPRLGVNLIYIVSTIGYKLKLIKDPKQFNYRTTKSIITNAKCLKHVAKTPHLLITNFILSCVEQIALVSVAYFTLRSFGFNWEASGILEWLQICVLGLIVNAAVCFVPTPGSSGAADLSFYLLFSKELQVGLAFPAMITWRLVSFYLVIVVGFIFIRRFNSGRG